MDTGMDYYQQTYSFDDIAQEVYYEPTHLESLFNSTTAMSPLEWFIVASCFVGAVTIVILGIKFTPAGKFLRSLFTMWANLLRSSNDTKTR